MDYCHPCRRHLNGALACPGCGTPAEACREYARSLTARDESTGRDDGHDADSPRAGGRAGGRARARGRVRRGERGRAAHRRRRRKVLLVTAGLALAAGGLSLAELGTEGPSEQPAAASAPDGGGEGESASTTPGTAPGGGASAEEAAATATASATGGERAEDAGRKKKKKDREDGADPGEAEDGQDERG
uniref:SCO2400 family protein n=1 Tax=Streptomyces flavofungini TaxID=68200 RepID=UPI0034DE0F10